MPRAVRHRLAPQFPIPVLVPLVLALAVAVWAPSVQAQEDTPAAEPTAPRPMTADDLWAMQRVGDPVLSPDGRWAVFPVSVYSADDNKGNSDLWLVPADGSAAPRRLTWNPGSDGSPAWSPDGTRLAFVSKRGEGPPQLYVLPLAGGEAEPVTDLPVAVEDPKWFPDGRRIAFAALTWPDLDGDFEAVGKRLDERKDDPVQAKIGDTRLLRYWDEYRTDGRFHHLFAVDLASGEVTDLTPGWDRLGGFGGLAWDLAPDGGEIVLAANSTAPPYRELDFDLWAVPLTGGRPGEPRNLTAGNPAADGSPRYSPDGAAIVYGRNRRPNLAPDFTRLARYDRTTGERRELMPEWDGEPSGWSFTPDGGTILFHAAERGRVHLYAVPAAGGSPRLVARGGSLDGAEAAPDGAGGVRVVYSGESITSPAELYAVPLGGGDPAPLTAFNAERLAGLDLGTVGAATFTGAGGDPVHMLLVYPPGYDPARQWPLLHLVHGGPHGAFSDRFHYRWNAALFAAPGYLVAMVNFHGSTGYGQAFAESILGNHADKPFADVMAATDHLLATGTVDGERMAAAGGSYGGYLVSWILGHTDRFAALVDHAGVYDLMGQFASDYTWSRPQNYGAAPWTDPERIDLYSPSRFAAHFETPTLILHGEKDYRVPYTQGVNLYGVLQGKGVPARIVVFPDENHWILKPRSAFLWWREVHGWLERWIGSGPTPAE